MILALLLAAGMAPPAPVPAPPGAPVDWNYDVDCRLFAADGTADRIKGRFVYVNRYRASASLVATGRYPVDAPGTPIPILGPGEFVVYGGRPDAHYTYFFNLPAGLPGNGIVRVAAPGGPGMNWAATGICEVSRTKAESR